MLFDVVHVYARLGRKAWSIIAVAHFYFWPGDCMLDAFVHYIGMHKILYESLFYVSDNKRLFSVSHCAETDYLSRQPIDWQT